MFDAFPRYKEYEPQVPVWCLTPKDGRAIHRFFDTSPISPSGRYLAVFRLPFEDRLPQPGDAGQICVIDLVTGEDRVVGQTCGWETQLGANLNWGATDNELYFNDVDTQTWEPFAWKLDPLTGRKDRMASTVYHASPDGRFLISANMRTMRRTQPGYGVCIPLEQMGWNVGPSQTDGFFLTDTSTGQSRLLATLHDLFFCANPQMSEQDAMAYEIYGFHSKFNAQSNRLMLSLRWYPKRQQDQWDMFAHNFKQVDYAWLTIATDGTDMQCAVGPGWWKRPGHHATWFPDGKRISMNLAMEDDAPLSLVQVNYDGTALGKMHEQVRGSGHPTVHSNGRYVLTDTYVGESMAWGDGTVPLRWIDLQTGSEQPLVRINTASPHEQIHRPLRIDPHPAWDRTERFVTFNGYVGGTRRVFVADMQSVLS
jgi:hypothetical protein